MRVSQLTAIYGSLLIALATSVTSVAHTHHHEHVRRDGDISITQAPTSPLVFAHYMISFQPPNLDYSNDINLARAAGIDAFAVNYGGTDASWPFFASYLDTFYKQAEKMGFKLFLCMDTTSVPDAAMVVNLTNFYAGSSAQMKDDKGNIFLSSFETNAPPWNWQTDVIDNIKVPVTFLPGTISEDPEYTAATDDGFGPFTWVHPASDVSQENATDTAFAAQRTSTSKAWMAGVAPWFFKRMGADENWSHAQDSGIWLDRWMSLLKIKPNYIEIVTWNDFGECSYIGPSDPTSPSILAQTSTTDYYGNLDHSAFLKMTAIFIKAFKAGDTTVTVSPDEEDIFFFYRIQPALTNGATDSLPLPENATLLQDNVYILPFLASEATIYLDTGGKTISMEAPVGVSKGSIPWSLGNQTITASRSINGATLNKTGPAIVSQLPRYQGNVVAL